MFRIILVCPCGGSDWGRPHTHPLIHTPEFSFSSIAFVKFLIGFKSSDTLFLLLLVTSFKRMPLFDRDGIQGPQGFLLGAFVSSAADWRVTKRNFKKGKATEKNLGSFEIRKQCIRGV